MRNLACGLDLIAYSLYSGGKKSYFCGDESGNIKKEDQYAGGKRASLDLCQRSK